VVVVLLSACSVFSDNLFDGRNQDASNEATQLDDIAHINNIELTQSIANSIQEDIVETTGNQEGLPYWAIQPAHTEVYFNDYALTDTFHDARIYLYSVDKLTESNPAAAEQIDALQTMLENPTTEADGTLPMLPLINATQMMQAHLEQLDFANGSGIRYLTQMGQAPAPINNKELFYTFQGLTDDGSIYVAAILPVSNPLLDAATSTGSDTNLVAQIADTARVLNQATEDSFTPSLSQLDAMIASIDVH
jgi:hypothetical protein